MYLNAHSYYSLRYGTLSPEDLVNQAVAMGITTLALTDINNVSGIFEFVKFCRMAGIQPVVGVEFRNHNELVYVCLARNTAGFAEINQHLSNWLVASKDFPIRAPSFQHAVVIYPLHRLNHFTDLAEHEFVGIPAAGIPQLYRYRQKLKPHQVVVLQPMSYADKTGFSLHRLLRCIAHNCLLSKLAEYETVLENEYILSPRQLETAFQSWPQIITNTRALLNSCSFGFDFDTPKNKKLYTPSKEDDMALLRKLAEDGLRDRYGPDHQEARRRVEGELKIIDDLDFTSYFLITRDIISYAHGRGYHHVGRGSGANSIVAYCMQITDVDPIALDLYFERFINPGRTSPPDFDIDFSWDERDEIIDYVFKKYGRHHVCLMANYVTFRDRAAYRELGKVFGLPKAEIDALVKDPRSAPPNQYTRFIFRYAPLLEDFPNYLSIHAGGILISELPLYHYTALQMMPKGFPICQFDMRVAEDIGFAKWDVLSQRGLGHIKEAVDLVRKNRQISVDIHRIQDFKDDENIRRQLLSHETMGCFYIESPAMRQLIWKLQVADYLTLVAASSIIRPGVASSGMMAEYVRRHHNPADYTAVHPKMQELMAETYGVMIYQEDVIKVAHHFAGLTLGEADILRRAMSGKYRSKGEFVRIEQKFFANCRDLGYTDEVAREVWRQIQSFGGYSFSKAHSASFAVESYQSLFLKTYYPLEFAVAVINNFGGFYRTEFYVHEARRWGAHIEAPDLASSEYLTRIEGHTIWLGFVHIKGLEKTVVQELLQQRRQQPFANLDDFTRRVPAGLEQLIILIRTGVFRSFGSTKKELLWIAHALVNSYVQHEGIQELFALEETNWSLPVLWQDEIEDSYDEIELLGFPLRSPFDLLASKVVGTSARQLAQQEGRIVTLVGYLITHKLIRTKNGKPMTFGYFVDYEGHYFDTTHFPQSLEKYPYRGMGMYRIEGKVVVDFGCPSVEVRKFEKLPVKPDPRGGTELFLN
ncbi:MULTISPECIES: DNA polymerase III subunit alpha [Larkinella]|uniref:DNA polymerase III subunit alpha n=1 Tax=Larkinella humicola TaxID=2607654 RepID=A0A5N1JKA4_9BACT|nr:MULTISPECIES: DNA polymerase III subunit alpha [Larkinella]KAA9356885.1 DNA polymerase III subunit alpha [Larkinella humicola]